MSFIKIETKSSTSVKEVSYDETNQKMRVSFCNPNYIYLYEYSDVSPEEIEQIKTAESVGKTMKIVIKNKSYVKVDE